MDDDTELVPRGPRFRTVPPPASFAGTARYRVERELGKGGMGQVFEVHDLELGTRVALKCLNSTQPGFLLRFKDEFRALCDIVHPNLVRLGELHEEGGQFFFTMELLTGTDFMRHVRPEAAVLAQGPGAPTSTTSPGTDAPTVARRTHTSTGGAAKLTKSQELSLAHGVPIGGFDEYRLRAAFAQLAVGLAALHHAGKIHRDLKPSNVQVEPDGRVVILDFGVSTDLDTSCERDTHVVGTLHYMAPEQARGERGRPEADWYAAGVVLYQALSGRLPYAARDPQKLALLKCEFDAPSLDLGEHESVRDLVTLAERLLSRRPEDRPPEAEILEILGLGEGAAWLTASTLVDPGASVVIGRERELETLRAAVADARTRGPLTLLVEGPSGMGKSSLLRAFIHALSRESALVLTSRCHEKESVRFKAFDGIVDGVARHLSGRTKRSHAQKASPDELSALCRVFPVLCTVPGLDRGARNSESASDPVEVRARAFFALRAMLRQLAEMRPLVLCIDDAHWADADSLALLESLLRPPHAPRLCVIMTRRPLDHDPLAPLSLGEVRTLALGALDKEASRELVAHVRAREGRAFGADVSSMFAESGGHPMFLEELARLGQGEAHALRLEDALASRVLRLSGSVQRLLEVIAAAGHPLQHRVAAAVARLTPSAYAHAVENLREARFVRVSGLRKVDAVELYHDRVRAAVLGMLAPEQVRGLHDALAQALLEHVLDPALVAEHLELGSHPERAAEFCLTAADEARAALAFERAARLRRRALSCGDFPDDERVRLLEEIADDLSCGGFAREAADALDEAAGRVELVYQRVDFIRRAAELYLSSGHLELGVAAARRALAYSGQKLSESRTMAIFSFLWTDARIGMARFRMPKASEKKHDLRGDLEADVLWSLGVGLALVDSVQAAGLANLALLHAAQLKDPQRMARALCAAAALASATGRFSRAERMRVAFDRALDLAMDPTIRLYRQIADLAHSFLCQNDWQRTLRTAYEARATWNLLGQKRGWEKAQLAQLECWALHQLGDVHALRTRVAENVREAQQTGNRFVEVNFRTFFIDMALADDDPGGALADVLAAASLWKPWSNEFGNQDYLVLCSRTRIALYMGNPDDPTLDADWQRFDGSLMRRVPLLLQDSLRLRAALALMRARRGQDREKQLARVRSLARALGRVPLPLARLETLPLRAALCALTGDEDGALALLREGLAGFRERSMALWCACLAHELGRRVGGSEGARLLTEASQSFERHRIRNPAFMLRACVPGLSELY